MFQYCEKFGDLAKYWWELEIADMAKLNLQQVKKSIPRTLSNHGSTPFLKYSARDWGEHTVWTRTMHIYNIRTLALELLNQYSRTSLSRTPLPRSLPLSQILLYQPSHSPWWNSLNSVCFCTKSQLTGPNNSSSWTDYLDFGHPG